VLRLDLPTAGMCNWQLVLASCSCSNKSSTAFVHSKLRTAATALCILFVHCCLRRSTQKAASLANLLAGLSGCLLRSSHRTSSTSTFSRYVRLHAEVPSCEGVMPELSASRSCYTANGSCFVWCCSRQCAGMHFQLIYSCAGSALGLGCLSAACAYSVHTRLSVCSMSCCAAGDRC
jgi:hypothetical protein